MTFDEYWATTGPWPDNILGTAFRELAAAAFQAGRESLRDELISKPAKEHCSQRLAFGVCPIHPEPVKGRS